MSALVAATAGAADATAATGQTVYWDLSEFKQLMRLVPELGAPRPANLAQAGYALWERGDLRMPATEATTVDGDFDGNGERDRAVLIETGSGVVSRFLLVATRHNGVWRRGLLVRAEAAGDLVWDERRRLVGLDTGRRRRISRPATMKADLETGAARSEFGFVLEERLLVAFGWNASTRRFERRPPYWYRRLE